MRVPCRHWPTVVTFRVSAAASTANQVRPFSSPVPTTVMQTPLQAIDAPSAIDAALIAAADLEPMMQALSALFDREYLADVSDNPGEHLGALEHLDPIRPSQLRADQLQLRRLR